LLNGSEFLAEVGKGGMDLRPDETLKLIDDLERFQIDHH
jgi:hypothetical protein